MEDLSMTKPSKSGGVVKNKAHDARILEDHVNNQFTTHDGKHNWFGQEVEVQSDPMIDTGTGKPIVMRFFEFKADPIAFKRANPSNQELFSTHAKEIRTFLYKDGLTPIEMIEPRIIREKTGYKIMITCEPQRGVVLTENTQTLQHIFNGK